MLLGVGRADVHIVLWGSRQQPGGQLDMRIGLPAATLQQLLGIRGLPGEYVLPLRVGGTTEAPVVDWQEASSKKLTILSALQAYRRSKQQGELGLPAWATPAAPAAAAGDGGVGGSWWERAMRYISSSTAVFP